MRFYLRARVQLVAFLTLSALCCAQGSGRNNPAVSGNTVAPEDSPFRTMSGTTQGPTVLDKSGPLVFRSRAQNVLVPVVVRDSKGNHISGLKKENFSLYEAGKPVEIVSFDEVKIPRGGQGASHGYDPLDNRSVPQRPLISIVFDVLNTPIADQYQAKQSLLQFLDETLDGTTNVQLVLLSGKGVEVLHDYTGDPVALKEAVKKIRMQLDSMNSSRASAEAGASFMNQNYDVGGGGEAGIGQAVYSRLSELVPATSDQFSNYMQGRSALATVLGLRSVAESLRGVPGRKALVWLSAAFPFTLTEPGTLEGFSDFQWNYMAMFHAMGESNVAMYPVDVRGLRGSGVADFSVLVPAQLRQQNPMAAIQRQNALLNSTQETFKTFAEMTGGKALYNSNDIKAGVQRAIADSSEFYMIAYAVPKTNTKQGWREIKVKTSNVSGAQVQARKGYFLTQSMLDPQDTRRASVIAAVNSPLSFSGIGMTLKWLEPSIQNGKRRVPFEISIYLNDLLPQITESGMLDLELVYVVRTPQGTSVRDDYKTVRAKVEPAAIEQLRKDPLKITDVIELDPGQYVARFVLRDAHTGRIGSIVAPLRTTDVAATAK